MIIFATTVKAKISAWVPLGSGLLHSDPNEQFISSLSVHRQGLRNNYNIVGGMILTLMFESRRSVRSGHLSRHKYRKKKSAKLLHCVLVTVYQTAVGRACVFNWSVLPHAK